MFQIEAGNVSSGFGRRLHSLNGLFRLLNLVISEHLGEEGRDFSRFTLQLSNALVIKHEALFCNGG
ncbi:hypothetical protein D3C84_998740 [compost metagenome]